MSVAAGDDVELALGRPFASPQEAGQVDFWLDGLELIICARLGELTLLDQDVLRYVEAEAIAAKVLRRAHQESSITVAVGDGSVTRRYENRVSASDVTDEWWALLSLTPVSSAYSVAVTSPLDSR